MRMYSLSLSACLSVYLTFIRTEYIYGKILVTYTEKICRLKSHRLCVIFVDRLESQLNIMNLLIEKDDR